jgi:cytochrome c oxidase subunit 2
MAVTMWMRSGIAQAQFPTNIFSPAATPAHSIVTLSGFVLSIALAIFLIVGGLLLYALIRYRHRPSQLNHEPAQVYGSNQIEISWTVIPVLIVVMLFLTTTRFGAIARKNSRTLVKARKGKIGSTADQE